MAILKVGPLSVGSRSPFYFVLISLSLQRKSLFGGRQDGSLQCCVQAVGGRLLEMKGARWREATELHLSFITEVGLSTTSIRLVPQVIH